MLHAISWKQFLTTIGLATFCWYAWLLFRYFPGWARLAQLLKPRKKTFPSNRAVTTGDDETKEPPFEKIMALIPLGIFMSIAASAQTADGNTGINQANTMVRSYFDTGVNLMYAIGALVGLIGAVRVYQKWSHGDHETGKIAANWFGSCIFLVVVATLLRSFFGL